MGKKLVCSRAKLLKLTRIRPYRSIQLRWKEVRQDGPSDGYCGNPLELSAGPTVRRRPFQGAEGSKERVGGAARNAQPGFYKENLVCIERGYGPQIVHMNIYIYLFETIYAHPVSIRPGLFHASDLGAMSRPPLLDRRHQYIEPLHRLLSVNFSSVLVEGRKRWLSIRKGYKVPLAPGENMHIWRD